MSITKRRRKKEHRCNRVAKVDSGAILGDDEDDDSKKKKKN